MLTDELVSAVELRGDDWAAQNTESHVVYMEQDCANSVDFKFLCTNAYIQCTSHEKGWILLKHGDGAHLKL